MELNTRHLEMFVALVRYQSVTRTARELGVSQPLVTKAIQALERRLQCELFHRLGRRLVLSPSGAALFPRAEQIVDHVRALGNELPGAVPGLQGTLRLGVTSTIANTLLPVLVVEFAKQHPRVKVQVEVANYRSTLLSLQEHRIDLGLVAADCQEDSMEVLHWMWDSLEIFCAPGHPLAARPWHLADLQAMDWVVREPGSGTRTLFDQSLQKLKVAPQIRLELGSNEAVLGAVLAGAGIGFLSSLLLQPHLEAGRIKILRPPGFPVTRPFQLVGLQSRITSQLLSAFQDFLRNLNLDPPQT